MTLTQEQETELLEALESWKYHLEDIRPILRLLEQHGCTPGEAIVALEMAAVRNYIERVLDGPQDDWKDDD